MNDIFALYDLWKEKNTESDLAEELASIESNEAEISDRFFKNMQFGTAGLRGVIGAGTNRMNVYTVGQATQGLAEFLNSSFSSPSVAIAYDSRIKSEDFARYAAGVLAANGIKVYIYPTLVPTPMLSFAVRYLQCSGGIILTASHNPAKYNGYKCYNELGYQMTDEAAAVTYGFIEKIDMFDDVKSMPFDKAIESGMASFIGNEVCEAFYAEVEKICLSKELSKTSDLKLIYTPLNGTGNIPVRKMLSRIGIDDVTVVPEQELPDGNFPTCPFPNPEIRQVFELAIEMGKKSGADLLLATDPDCDRVGIAVKDGDDYKLMTGNEVAVMLSEYTLSRRKELGILPKDPTLVKSFVTTSLVDAVAASHGAKVVNVLTGFKYIGEYITKIEAEGHADDFVLGMEESYGYLAGIHARDKDAVVASALICEMAAYYKNKGISLIELMNSLYKKHGYYLNALDNFQFEGAAGMQKMADIMSNLRQNPPCELGDMVVERVDDYIASTSTDVANGSVSALTLPKSNVLAYFLPGGNGLIIRPSGTEPKIKCYYTGVGENEASAKAIVKKIAASAAEYLK